MEEESLILYYLKNGTKKVYEVYFYKHNRIFYITVDKDNIYLLHACKKQKNKNREERQKYSNKRAKN